MAGGQAPTGRGCQTQNQPVASPILSTITIGQDLLSGLLTCGTCGGGIRSERKTATAAPRAVARERAQMLVQLLDKSWSAGCSMGCMAPC